jgi:hypothetical protein
MRLDAEPPMMLRQKRARESASFSSILRVIRSPP